MEKQKLAVILIRGMVQLSPDLKKTLDMLNLQRRNTCSIVDNSRISAGMINKVKSFVTFGEIDESTLKALKEKKGEEKIYHLNSPKKGYGRKGIKKDFSQGGGLGYRGDKINDLIKRML